MQHYPSLRRQRLSALPGPTVLPGGCTYEPKWDGFRLLIARHSPTRTTLWSRQGTHLSGQFPDLVAAATAQVPTGTVLDGEVVVWADDRLSFTTLLRRLSSSPRNTAALARRIPVSYVAFDVLAHAGQDMRRWPWTRRRGVLEDLAAEWSPPMNLCPSTSDVQVAAGWFDELTVAGIEGLVIKGKASPYRGGSRDWLKIKHRTATDVICVATLGAPDAPSGLVLSLPMDGRLQVVGQTTPLSRTAARDIGRLLVPSPAQGKDRTVTAAFTGLPLRVTEVEPLVVEVAADTAWTGRAFRHPLRLLRARPDVDPSDVEAPTA